MTKTIEILEEGETMNPMTEAINESITLSKDVANTDQIMVDVIDEDGEIEMDVIDNEGREDKDATIDLSPVSETIDRDVVEEKKRDLGGLFDDLEKKRQDILRKKQELEDAEQEIHNQMNGTAGAIQVCREFLGEVPTD